MPLFTFFFLFLLGLALKDQIFLEEPIIKGETQHLRFSLKQCDFMDHFAFVLLEVA